MTGRWRGARGLVVVGLLGLGLPGCAERVDPGHLAETQGPTSPEPASPEQGGAKVWPSRSFVVRVENDLEVARKGEVVTSGLPFPAAWKVTEPSILGLVDANGEPVPAQFRVAARWGGPLEDRFRPVMWTWVSFPVDLESGEGGEYRVVVGAGPGPEPEQRVTVSSDGAGVQVDTGVARFFLDPSAPGLLTSVTMGDRVVARGDPEGFLCLSISGDPCAASSGPMHLDVTAAGPLEARVEALGSLVDAAGQALLDVEAVLVFRVGSSALRGYITVGNHAQAAVNEEQSSYDVYDYFGRNSVTFDGLALKLMLNGTGTTETIWAGEGGGVSSPCRGPLVVYQESSGTDYWGRYASPANAPRLQSQVTFRGYQVVCGGEEVAQGDHFPGWFDVAGPEGGLAAGIRAFWQNYPMALEANGTGGVVVGLLPDRFPGLFNFRVGEEKTWEVVLQFHTEDTGAAEVAGQMAGGLSPLVARADPERYADHRLGLPFLRFDGTVEERMGRWNDPDPLVRHAYYIDRALVADPGMDETAYYYPFHCLWLSTPGHPSSTDYFEMHGWSWYGNQPLEEESFGEGMSGPFNVKYNLDYGVWLQFLATGDSRWFAMGEAYTRHLEALMLHDVVTETGWDVARWKNAIFGHSEHNETGNENSVRNHLGPVMDTAFGARGSLLYYFLTGYPPSGRFVVDAANYAYDFYRDVSRETRPDFAPSREAGNLVNILTEGFRLTGDRKYQQLLHRIVSQWAAAQQPYIHGPIPGSPDAVPTWIFALYYDAVARYAVLAEEAGLADEAALARKQVEDYVRWHITYAVKEPQGWLTTYYYYRLDGDNDPENPDMVNNWTLLLADACAWASVFARQDGLDQDATRFFQAATRFYQTGTFNPYYLGSPLVYSSSKEAVNALVFGHVYTYVASGHFRTGDGPRKELLSTP